MANKSLTQVADTLSTIGYVISCEGDEIASKDLYAFATDLEDAIASILLKARAKEENEIA